MVFDSLKNIDIQTLQSITAKDIKDYLLSHLTMTINVILILVTLLSLIFIGGTQANYTSELKNKVEQLKGLVDSVKKNKSVEGRFAEFMKTVPPPLNSQELQKTLSELAAKHNIQILSFLPKEAVDNDYLHSSNFEMNIVSAKYSNIVLFTDEVEHLRSAIRIDKWAGKTDEQEFKGQDIDMNKVPISAVIDISIVGVKEFGDKK
jgi:Tfp pilus assembly protein PilO